MKAVPMYSACFAHNKPFEPTPGTMHRFLMSRGGAAQRQRCRRAARVGEKLGTDTVKRSIYLKNRIINQTGRI